MYEQCRRSLEHNLRANLQAARIIDDARHTAEVGRIVDVRSTSAEAGAIEDVECFTAQLDRRRMLTAEAEQLGQREVLVQVRELAELRIEPGRVSNCAGNVLVREHRQIEEAIDSRIELVALLWRAPVVIRVTNAG